MRCICVLKMPALSQSYHLKETNKQYYFLGLLMTVYRNVSIEGDVKSTEMPISIFK